MGGGAAVGLGVVVEVGIVVGVGVVVEVGVTVGLGVAVEVGVAVEASVAEAVAVGGGGVSAAVKAVGVVASRWAWLEGPHAIRSDRYNASPKRQAP